MSQDIEDQLIAGMRDHVEDVALTTDVVGAAVRRYHRRTALRRAIYAAGVAGIAGALAAVIAVNGGGPLGSGNSQPHTTNADSAALRLAGAIAASQNVSYRLKISSSFEVPGYPEERSGPWVMHGAFDPATATGYLKSPHEAHEQRLIGGVMYVGTEGKTFYQYTKRFDSFAFGELHGAFGASADPARLFELLQQKHAVISQTSATGFHFEVELEPDSGPPAEQKLAGDVTLNADNRIAMVSTVRTVRFEKTGEKLTNLHLVTVELSDYGMPVTVERPTDVVVKG